MLRRSEPHCLYRAWSADDRLLYVGISISALDRLGQHRRGGAEWFEQVAKITLEHFANRADALAAEGKAIREERPRFNIVGRYLRPKPLRPVVVRSLAELQKERAPDGSMARFLTRMQMAEVFGIKVDRIKRLILEDDFPQSIKIGTERSNYWRLHEVKLWLSGRPELWRAFQSSGS